MSTFGDFPRGSDILRLNTTGNFSGAAAAQHMISGKNVCRGSGTLTASSRFYNIYLCTTALRFVLVFRDK